MQVAEVTRLVQVQRWCTNYSLDHTSRTELSSSCYVNMLFLSLTVAKTAALLMLPRLERGSKEKTVF